MTTDYNLGRTLRDRYRLTRLLGQGSMGRVYEADDDVLGDVPVAVKFLSQTLLTRGMLARFEQEAKTCAQLGQRSMHIVRVMDYGVDEDGIPFYVMEYLKGESLTEVIKRQALLLPRFLNLTRQICLGLQCAHQGIKMDGMTYPIVHRDIKPSNILVSQDDSLGELVKILDFGIAKILQSEVSQTGCFMGTLAYASPEQMEGHELDARSDIYSLGIMMFQMLTGAMPLLASTQSFGGWYKVHHFHQPKSFEEADPNAKLPKLLEELVVACLAKAPSDRPQNVAQILEALKPLEERYGAGREVARRIEASLNRKLPIKSVAQDWVEEARPSRYPQGVVLQPKGSDILSTDEVFQLAAWPKTMPIAEIVFPRALPSQNGNLATLWVMLPKAEIEKRMVCTRYNQFLFMEAPHPMVLWLTVLYNREHGPRWLPCYLDLKTTSGRQMTMLLGNAGKYNVLFFQKQSPEHCINVQASSIAPGQCKLLRDWANLSTSTQSQPVPDISKEHLKAALETLKPKILMKLESIHNKGDESLSY
ncbi:MAG: serine/threonine protein kinase [Timaviella obliquedivisa GSE-PSE-MK23-08B]|nr:serine/threonine protein kinase [Timaviella obliquedivisa GSE-PSE-MK23-08B]